MEAVAQTVTNTVKEAQCGGFCMAEASARTHHDAVVDDQTDEIPTKLLAECRKQKCP